MPNEPIKCVSGEHKMISVTQISDQINLGLYEAQRFKIKKADLRETKKQNSL